MLWSAASMTVAAVQQAAALCSHMGRAPNEWTGTHTGSHCGPRRGAGLADSSAAQRGGGQSTVEARGGGGGVLRNRRGSGCAECGTQDRQCSVRRGGPVQHAWAERGSRCRCGRQSAARQSSRRCRAQLSSRVLGWCSGDRLCVDSFWWAAGGGLINTTQWLGAWVARAGRSALTLKAHGRTGRWTQRAGTVGWGVEAGGTACPFAGRVSRAAA